MPCNLASCNDLVCAMVAVLTVIFAALLAVKAAPSSSPLQRRASISLKVNDSSNANATNALHIQGSEDINDAIPLLLMPPAHASEAPPESTLSSSEPPLLYTTVTEIVTTTILSQLPASTLTLSVTLPPEIEISTVATTDTVTATSTVFVEPSSPIPADPSQGSWPGPPSRGHLPNLPGRASWTCPWALKDLTPFNVTQRFGGANLRFITGIPPMIRSTDSTPPGLQPSLGSQGPPITTWHPNEVSLQLLYPKGSVNPGRKPQGGMEFYASPLEVHTARTVTLRYSVYFPKDFTWVLGGKLPGLYGGHSGCSGGNAALDCFSTRLMWRQGGIGELYLYASKEKQTKALCSHPQSECNSAYGFSIGRGSFKWIPGEWTTVEQTVSLNTPGKQDGIFRLLVNGRKVLERQDVFYRDVLWPGAPAPPSAPRPPTAPRPPATPPTMTKKPARPKPTKPAYGDDPLGDILGPLLSQIGKLVQRDEEKTMEVLKSPISTSSPPGFTGMQSTTRFVQTSDETQVLLSPGQAFLDRALDGSAERQEEGLEDDVEMSILGKAPRRLGNTIGFAGIFFSTFFGGHADKYATPRDQYVWFKDFALAYVN